MKAKINAREVEMAKKNVTKALASARTQYSRLEKDVRKKINSNPEQAMLIAGAIGAAIGAVATHTILNRKKKKLF